MNVDVITPKSMKHPRQFPLLALFVLIAAGCTPKSNMPFTPRPEDPWFVRTHFADDAKWNALVAAASAPIKMSGNEYFANFNPVDNAKHTGMSPLDVVNALPDDYPQYFVLVGDASSHGDNPTVLVVNFLPQFDESYETLPRERTETHVESFRAAPDTLQSITNNLSISNMGFEEFAESVDDDGVFRGF